MYSVSLAYIYQRYFWVSPCHTLLIKSDMSLFYFLLFIVLTNEPCSRLVNLVTVLLYAYLLYIHSSLCVCMYLCRTVLFYDSSHAAVNLGSNLGIWIITVIPYYDGWPHVMMSMFASILLTIVDLIHSSTLSHLLTD